MEDHALLADSLQVALGAAGHDAHRAPAPERGQHPSTYAATVTALHPRLVLLDLDLDGFDGTTLIEPLTRGGVRVMVLTSSVDRGRWGLAVHLGAGKVVGKSRPLPDLLATVRRLSQGLPVMSKEERCELIGHWEEQRIAWQRQVRFEQLTPRERQVLAHLMRGRMVREIAQRDTVSEATIRTQVKVILSKLEVSSQLAAVGLAHEVGWRGPAV